MKCAIQPSWAYIQRPDNRLPLHRFRTLLLWGFWAAPGSSSVAFMALLASHKVRKPLSNHSINWQLQLFPLNKGWVNKFPVCRLQVWTKPGQMGTLLLHKVPSNLLSINKVLWNTVLEYNGNSLFRMITDYACHHTSMRESCLAISRCKQPQSRTDISRHHRSRLQKSQLAKFNGISQSFNLRHPPMWSVKIACECHETL